MDYFEKFVNVLHGNFHDDFNSLMDATTRFDCYQGIPRSIKEVDKRPPQPVVYAKPKEPEPTPEIDDDIQFEVIDLEAEMDKRRKSTEGNNSVQIDSSPPYVMSEKLTMTLKRRVTKTSPRGAVIQTQTSEGKTTETVIHGNRAQRKAAAAILRKATKHGNKGKGSNRDNKNSDSQKENSPTRIDLSDLTFGFKLE